MGSISSAVQYPLPSLSTQSVPWRTTHSHPNWASQARLVSLTLGRFSEIFGDHASSATATEFKKNKEIDKSRMRNREFMKTANVVILLKAIVNVSAKTEMDRIFIARSCGLTAVANTVESCRGAEQEAVANKGGSSHTHVFSGEFVDVENFQFVTRFEDECFAGFVEAEYFAVVGPRGSAEIPNVSRQTFAFDDGLARHCIVAAEFPAVVENIEPVLVNDGGGIVGCAEGIAPGDEFVGGFVFFKANITGSAGVDGV